MPNFPTQLIFNAPKVTEDSRRIRHRRNNFGLKAGARPIDKRFSMQAQYHSEKGNLLKTLFKKSTLNNGRITDSKGGLGLPHLVKRNQPLNLSGGSKRISTVSAVSGLNSGSSYFGSRKAFTGSGSSMWSQLSSTLTLKQKISRQKFRAKKRFKMDFRRKMKLSFGVRARRLKADSRLRLRNLGRNLSLNALVHHRVKGDSGCLAIESHCPVDVMKATAMWNAKLKREYREKVKADKQAAQGSQSQIHPKGTIFYFSNLFHSGITLKILKL